MCKLLSPFTVTVAVYVLFSDDFLDWEAPLDVKLIEEYKKRKPRFDDAQTKASTLYGEIAVALKDLGYEQFNAERCCNRMGDLAEKFKDRYDKVRFQTGVGKEPTDWAYYDEFAKMFEGTAILEPQKLLNMGSSFSATTRTPASTNRHGRKDQPKKTVSPVSQKERKVQIGEGILQQLTRMNDHILKEK